MKLVIAVVQDSDCDNLLEKLIKKGFRATKLASTGGFLRDGNTTLILGVEIEKVDMVTSIIEEVCKKREKAVPYLMHSEPSVGMAMPVSGRITAGGAAVFVLDVEQYIKV